MRDTRLLGTWRSDARRTVRDLRARRDIPEKTRRALQPLFGKLELRYTPTRCVSTLYGDTRSEPYRVVAKDADSVAIVHRNVLGDEIVTHVHFSGAAVFWIPVGTGLFREFFRRVEPAFDARAGRRSVLAR